MPSADVERLDDADGEKEEQESIAAAQARVHYSTPKARSGTEQPETQLTSEDGNEATITLSRIGANDGGAKSATLTAKKRIQATTTCNCKVEKRKGTESWISDEEGEEKEKRA